MAEEWTVSEKDLEGAPPGVREYLEGLRKIQPRDQRDRRTGGQPVVTANGTPSALDRLWTTMHVMERRLNDMTRTLAPASNRQPSHRPGTKGATSDEALPEVRESLAQLLSALVTELKGIKTSLAQHIGVSTATGTVATPSSLRADREQLEGATALGPSPPLSQANDEDGTSSSTTTATQGRDVGTAAALLPSGRLLATLRPVVSTSAVGSRTEESASAGEYGITATALARPLDPVASDEPEAVVTLHSSARLSEDRNGEGTSTDTAPVSEISSETTAASQLSSLPQTIGRLGNAAALNSLPLLSSASAGTPANLVPTLRVSDLGSNLTASMESITQHPNFSGVVPIVDLGPVELPLAIQPPQAEYDLVAIEYMKNDSGTYLFLPNETIRFQPPDFSTVPSERPGPEEIRNWLENVITNPPQDVIPYYVGPSLADPSRALSQLDSLLHPGNELLELARIRAEGDDDGHIAGVTTLYYHLGAARSGTAFHCEDSAFLSTNLNLLGWKLWIIIDIENNDKFEELIKTRWGGGSCDQWVRHHRLVIAPSELRRHGIAHNILCAGPGDMVVTRARQYHMVINMTDSFAIAINNLLPGEQPFPQGIPPVCSECGLSAIVGEGHPNLQPLFHDTPRRSSRRTQRPPTIRPAEGSRLSGSVSSAPEATQAPRKRKAAPQLGGEQPPPKKIKPSPRALAANLTNDAAIRRFVNHVLRWRESYVSDFKVHGSCLDQAAEYFKISISNEQSSDFHQLLSLIAGIEMARKLDQYKADMNLTRAPKGTITEHLRKCHGKKITTRGFSARLYKWRKVCISFRDYQGLLPFVAFCREDNVPIVENYREMSDEERAEFSSHLQRDNRIGKLARIGKMLQESIVHCEAFPLRIWERFPQEVLTNLAPPRLLELLDVLHVEENGYEGSPNWTPDDFPQGLSWKTPDSVYAELQCAMCERDICGCITTCFPPPPCVSDFGQKGLSLQAGRAYDKDQLIGQIVGRIVAPSTYHDGLGLDFARSDLPGEPIVGQIYTKDACNIFRFMNHRCQNPSAIIQGMVISGKYRMVIRARRDIPCGEEISLDCGNQFLPRGKCLCEDCVHGP